jgi:hypothetical protein
VTSGLGLLTRRPFCGHVPKLALALGPGPGTDSWLMIKRYAVSLALVTACIAPMIVQGGPLGEPAAPLVVKAWLKGPPVEVKPGTNIFVVEIFSSAGLPSRVCITNLNEVQRRFKDQGLVVVGVSDEPVERLKEFVAQVGAGIEYSVAADDERKTSLSYMMGAGQRGIPHVFVVGKDGKLLWHGHPLHGLNAVLDDIMAGRYNVEEVAKRQLAQRQLQQYLAAARRGDPRTGETGRRLLEQRTNDVLQLCELAFTIANDPKIRQRQAPLAKEALDWAEKLRPTNTLPVAVTRAVLLFETGQQSEGLARAKEAAASAQGPKDKAYAEATLRAMETRLAAATTNQTPEQKVIQDQMKRYVMLARKDDRTAADAGRQLLGMLTNDVAQMCELAFTIATDSQIKKRDLLLADAALDRAEHLAPTNSTRVLVCRAVLLFRGGKREEGLALARRAVATAPNEQEKANAEAWLRKMGGQTEPAKTNPTEKPVAKP